MDFDTSSDIQHVLWKKYKAKRMLKKIIHPDYERIFGTRFFYIWKFPDSFFMTVLSKHATYETQNSSLWSNSLEISNYQGLGNFGG